VRVYRARLPTARGATL